MPYARLSRALLPAGAPDSQATLATALSYALPPASLDAERASYIDMFGTHLRSLMTSEANEARGAEALPFLPWTAARMQDLWLAFFACQRDAVALNQLETTVIAPLASQIDRSSADAEDAVQSLRMALLVGDGVSGPKLLAYAGKGELSRWVRVAATRMWLNRKRAVKREVSDEDVLMSEEAPMDAQLAGMKAAYREAFAEAFKTALRGLEPKERILLRQHHLDGLTMEQMGVLHGVHRLTVLRWIERVREKLATETRASMAAKLSLRDAEMNSVMRLIQSQMHVSLRVELGGMKPESVLSEKR
jgi:RNA polymerase sigma-70 factor (ECF subfamily)